MATESEHLGPRFTMIIGLGPMARKIVLLFLLGCIGCIVAGAVSSNVMFHIGGGICGVFLLAFSLPSIYFIRSHPEQGILTLRMAILPVLGFTYSRDQVRVGLSKPNPHNPFEPWEVRWDVDVKAGNAAELVKSAFQPSNVRLISTYNEQAARRVLEKVKAVVGEGKGKGKG